MTYLLGKAAVEDFEAWKSAFDRFDSFRTDHGQEGYQVFRNVDDQNEAVVLFELTELEFIDQKSTHHPSA